MTLRAGFEADLVAHDSNVVARRQRKESPLVLDQPR